MDFPTYEKCNSEKIFAKKIPLARFVNLKRLI